jgi:hypothetical protein
LPTLVLAFDNSLQSSALSAEFFFETLGAAAELASNAGKPCQKSAKRTVEVCIVWELSMFGFSCKDLFITVFGLGSLAGMLFLVVWGLLGRLTL